MGQKLYPIDSNLKIGGPISPLFSSLFQQRFQAGGGPTAAMFPQDPLRAGMSLKEEKKKNTSLYPVLSDAAVQGFCLRFQQALRRKGSAVLPKDTNFIQNAIERSMAKGIVENNGDLSGEQLIADWSSMIQAKRQSSLMFNSEN